MRKAVTMSVNDQPAEGNALRLAIGAVNLLELAGRQLHKAIDFAGHVDGEYAGQKSLGIATVLVTFACAVVQ